MARSLQRNASDPKQVRYAERKQRQREARFLAALREVLRTPAGRIVGWELLARAGVFRSVWDPSAKIHYNAGRQDYGHELLASMLEADEEAYQLMEREMRAYLRNEQQEAAAVQTPRADEGQQQEDTNG
jgi:hypothetical protein